MAVRFYGLTAMKLACAFFLSLAIVISGCAQMGGAVPEGLVAVPSTKIDELYVRRDTPVASYRRVFIEPVTVQFRSDYLSQRHALNYLLAEPLYKPYQDPDSVASDIASLMQTTLADAFRAAGYEVVDAPGPGVVRVAAKINDLFINAPDRLSSSVRASLNRNTGQATLLLEASDAASGALLARVAHHKIVREVSRLNVANDTTNRFWFEAAFRRWAGDVVEAFGASRRAEVSWAR
jgi:hypothetical protein